MERVFGAETPFTDWLQHADVGNRLHFTAASLPALKKIRRAVKRTAGEELIELKWTRPEPRSVAREREGCVGRWVEEDWWHVTALVTRRIHQDWTIKDNFPHQSRERAHKNQATLYQVANKGD
jgi:hypothetical protein